MRGATVLIANAIILTVISIHAPLAGRDLLEGGAGMKVIKFQSTRPLRGATFVDEEAIFDSIISIHAPLAGRDV